MYLNDLGQTLRAAGLSVNEQGGWQGRNHGAMSAVRTIVVHHTATSAASKGDYPSLAVVRDGRSDLPGPLAQLGVGRGGTVYVMSNGLAYHAGAVRNSAYSNNNSIGLEVESPGTGQVWPDVQVQATARAVAALCKHYGLSSANVLGHKEICSPVGRKSDPVGIPGDMPAFRNLVQQYINGKAAAAVVTEEDDDFMASVRIARWSGSNAVFAVTPLGHWQFGSVQDVNDFAFKYNLPRDGAGNALIEINNRTGWFGPNLTVVYGNVAANKAASDEVAKDLDSLVAAEAARVAKESK